MSAERTFIPDTFEGWQQTPEPDHTSSEMFQSTKASLDAFLAQQHEDGFFNESRQTSSDSTAWQDKFQTKKTIENATLGELGEDSAPLATQAKRSNRKNTPKQVKEQTFKPKVVEKTEADDYIPSDNPIINAIHDHMQEGSELGDEEIDFIADVVIEKLKDILSFYGENDIVIDEYEGDNGNLIFDISGGDLAVLIGHHGHTLDALQNIINAFLSNTLHFYYPVSIDVEGYKERRKKKIEAIALSAAARAKQKGTRVVLSPMSPADRRLVHLTLLDDSAVSTHSEGYEPNRRVVVSAKGRRRAKRTIES